MEIIDISPLINSRIAVFPGDTPFHEEFLMSTDKGENITLSKITTTVHLGAHVDAPNHYGPASESIETRNLDFYIGRCQVIAVQLPRGQRIQIADLKGKDVTEKRVLFKTMSFPNPEVWNDDFNSLSAELVEHLATKKVRLVGIDTPSIDLAKDKVLQSHLMVHKYDMAILEGIVLEQVPEGIYELIALPLKIEGADASPVRAILRKLKE